MTKIDALKLCRLLSWRRLREVIIYVLIFFIAGFLGNLWMTRDQIAGTVPDISVRTLAGDSVHFASIDSHKKPVLLYFFADWCPICKLQNSTMSSLAQDFDVIGIAMQSGDDPQLGAYLAQHDIHFPVINDRSGSLSRRFGVNGVPATFMIDAAGMLRYPTHGYASWLGLRSRLMLARLSVDQEAVGLR